MIGLILAYAIIALLSFLGLGCLYVAAWKSKGDSFTATGTLLGFSMLLLAWGIAVWSGV